MPQQHTIAAPVTLEGLGLHTGECSRVTLNPAPDNYGIRVVRTDVSPTVEIPADIDNVVDLARGTAIGIGDVRVYTMEHVMAACAGMGVDNCRIEVDASELPLLDGSSLPYVEGFQKCGLEEQKEQREYITVDEPVDHVDGDLALGVYPSDHFRLTVQIDYGHPALGVQYTTMFNLKDFASEFAPARTFCFLSEIEHLREKGLIKGGRVDSALIIQDVELTTERLEHLRGLLKEPTPLSIGTNGFLNNTLPRFPNEPCRHKALDLLGDLYLLGKPIKAHIFAARPGHATNHAMAKKLRAYLTRRTRRIGAPPPVSFREIMEILPHRYPFLLVDGVEKIEVGKSITAYKHVSFNDHFFQGHFPGEPIMPGVLQVEAMAQAAGIMALHGADIGSDRTILFMGIDGCRFRGIVRPGDKLRIELETRQNRRGVLRFDGKCFVGDTLVCEAQMMAMLGKKG